MSDIKRSRAEARTLRYLIDSLKDRDAADVLIRDNQFDMALFHIAQLCEKSTKACLAIHDLLITENKENSPIRTHIFSDLVKTHILPVSGDLKNDFLRLTPKLRDIESYYFDPRYGVDTSGRMSFDEYEESEVKEIYESALEYLELCFTFIEHNYGKKIPRKINELKEFYKSNYIGFVTR